MENKYFGRAVLIRLSQETSLPTHWRNMHRTAVEATIFCWQVSDGAPNETLPQKKRQTPCKEAAEAPLDSTSHFHPATEKGNGQFGMIVAIPTTDQGVPWVLYHP